jgi:hypothetical protein
MESELKLDMTRRSLLGSSVLVPFAPSVAADVVQRDTNLDITLKVNGRGHSLRLDCPTTLFGRAAPAPRPQRQQKRAVTTASAAPARP